MSCKPIRPLLFRAIEGETTPNQAMRIARHLADCTGCRIHLARERRLAEMLSRGLEDHLPVGEEFVRSVMATLPVGPPPTRNRRGRRLKLAGSTHAVAVGSLLLPAGLAHGHVAVALAARLLGAA